MLGFPRAALSLVNSECRDRRIEIILRYEKALGSGRELLPRRLVSSRISRERPKTPILAVTPNENIARRLCLMWGARSMLSEDVGFYEEMVETATRLAHDSGLVEPCDTIVVVAGIPFGQSGATNNLRVVRLG